MISKQTVELSEKLKQGIGMSESEMTELYKRLVDENALGSLIVLRTLEKFRHVLIEVSEINHLIQNK